MKRFKYIGIVASVCLASIFVTCMAALFEPSPCQINIATYLWILSSTYLATAVLLVTVFGDKGAS